ncbi:MAG: hypothetical protein ACI9GM_001282 [Salibacteraceae bacterium]|jgi:hypothetical protein
MLKQLILPLCLYLAIGCSMNVFSIGNQSSGARSFGLGNANVTLTDFWSANNNQAGLGGVRNFSIGGSYENRFGLSELGLSTLQMAIPVKFGTFGLTIQQFGFADYSESKFGIAYGMALSEKINLGGQIDYYHIQLAEAQTQNKDALAIELGIQVKLTEKFSMGAHLFNLTNSELKGDFQEKLPMILSLGIQYAFSPKLFAVVDLEKNIDLPSNLKAGVEYHPVKAFYFRGGLNTYDFHFTGGLGADIKGLKIDLGFSHQTYVGYVSQIALSYTIRK